MVGRRVRKNTIIINSRIIPPNTKLVHYHSKLSFLRIKLDDLFNNNNICLLGLSRMFFESWNWGNSLQKTGGNGCKTISKEL